MKIKTSSNLLEDYFPRTNASPVPYADWRLINRDIHRISCDRFSHLPGSLMIVGGGRGKPGAKSYNYPDHSEGGYRAMRSDGAGVKNREVMYGTRISVGTGQRTADEGSSMLSPVC